MGRAGVSRELRDRRGHRRVLDRGLEHAAVQGRGPARRQEGSELRQVGADVDVSGGALRRRDGSPGRQRRWNPARHPHRERQARARAVRDAGDQGDRALLQRLLRRALPFGQAGPDRASRRHSRRDGKLGGDRLQRRPLAVRPGRGFAAPAARGLRHHRARDRAPMVRQPRHDGLVGQLVAERGFRLVDGEQGRRALQPTLGNAAARSALERGGSVRGRAQDDPCDPDAGRERHARDGRLRFHHLRQGSRGPAHARGLSRRRRFPRGCAGLHAGASLFQYDHGRLLAPSVGSIGAGHRQTDRRLDRAAGIPGRESLAAVRKPRRRRNARPGALHAQRPQGGTACVECARDPRRRGREEAHRASRAELAETAPRTLRRDARKRRRHRLLPEPVRRPELSPARARLETASGPGPSAAALGHPGARAGGARRRDALSRARGEPRRRDRPHDLGPCHRRAALPARAARFAGRPGRLRSLRRAAAGGAVFERRLGPAAGRARRHRVAAQVADRGARQGGARSGRARSAVPVRSAHGEADRCGDPARGAEHRRPLRRPGGVRGAARADAQRHRHDGQVGGAIRAATGAGPELAAAADGTDADR